MTGEQITAEEVFAAKWYVNGFPKSGTHLLTQMLLPVARRLYGEEESPWARPWAGTFNGNSWTTEWKPLERSCFKVARLQAGTLLKAHTGHTAEIERFLYLLGVAHVFIYRDLRDVAVSLAHHILTEDPERLVHPGREKFRALGGFEEVLAAVIAGLDEYAGVVERWRLYAPWLEVPWTFAVRFEELRTEPKVWAEKVLAYGLNRTAKIWGRSVQFDPEGLDLVTEAMVAAGEDRAASPTFRKGAIGDWREAFAGRHVDLWRMYDAEDWLGRLGYGGF